MSQRNDIPRNDLPYEDAMHGVQAAIAFELQRRFPEVDDAQRRREKHLRVGIDSAHVTDGAVARLLIAKGVFTAGEYAEAVRLEANRELDRYEDRLRAETGMPGLSFR